MISLYNTTIYQRAYIYLDKIYGFWLNNASAGVTCTLIRFNFMVNCPVRYPGNGDDEAPIYGQLFMIVISDSVAVTHPMFTGCVNTWYNDN